jgi:tyramine---L-glutamate ligase
MKIVVLEHLTSAPRDPVTQDLEREGRAMRDAVVEDLRALPGVEVEIVDRAAAGEREALFRAPLRGADAGFVVAPETGGILARLSEIVEEERRLLLGPSSGAIRLLGDKRVTGLRLAAAGFPVPATGSLAFEGATARLSRRPLPFVLKPRGGCGAQGVVLVRRRDRIPAALAAVRGATALDDFLLQEFVRGDDASVSFIVGDEALALPLGRQHVRRGKRFLYLGGEIPWRHPLARQAIETARRAVAFLAGQVAALTGGAARLRGYVGVDLVLAPGGPRIIEVNPRLTTSYVGLRRVVQRNLAGLILDAALGRPLPVRVNVRGRCRFSADGSVSSVRAGGGDGKGRWRSISAGTSAASI